MSVPVGFPAKLTAGDTWRWRRTNLAADYPASMWTLTYILVGAGGVHHLNATADGKVFLVDIPAATTAAITAGIYKWSACVAAAGERFCVGEGTLTVLPDPATAAAADGRSHARRVLDAIEAVLEGRASRDQESYTIDGRSLSRTPIADLLILRDRYRAEARREKAAEDLARGKGSGRRIQVRFGG